jgi:hypothetical protein
MCLCHICGPYASSHLAITGIHKTLIPLLQNLSDNLLVGPFVLGKKIDVEFGECLLELGLNVHGVKKWVVEIGLWGGKIIKIRGDMVVCCGMEVGAGITGPIQRASSISRRSRV